MLKQILLLLLLVIPVVSAAQLDGNVYDNYLAPSMAIVEINTEPIQKLVVKNHYSFKVPIGTYTIKAYYNNLKTSEKVVITKDDVYNLDLVMFPNFEEEENLTNFDISTNNAYTKGNFSLKAFLQKGLSYWYFYLIGIGIILILVSIFIPKRKHKEVKEEIIEDELTDKLISFIKEKDGRVTQKDIRKQFPFSEAKISLLITELESKGILKKIKKGRTNVIVLNHNI